MILSIIIPNYNGADHLAKCIESLQKSTFTEFELIVIDNNSNDNSKDVFDNADLKKKWKKLDKNEGFAKAVNQGIKLSNAKYVMLLNNDTIVHQNALGSIISKFENNTNFHLGGIQALMLQMQNPNAIDDAGDNLSWYGIALKGNRDSNIKDIKIEENIFSPSGGATIYTKKFLRDVDFLDENFVSYLEDVDLGLRGQLYGYNFKIDKSAIVYHKGGGSNLAKATYIRLTTKNRLILFFKNMPAKLLFTQGPKIIYGQVFHFLSYASPLQSLLGIVDFIKMTPTIISKRKKVLSKTTLNSQEIKMLLNKKYPSPGLFFLAINFWKEIFKSIMKK